MILTRYHTAEGLRYGSVMVMTDQDLDGSHIKGLLINMFHFWWPNLLKVPGFLKEFATPIVKVTKGATKYQFFTLNECAASFFLYPCSHMHLPKKYLSATTGVIVSSGPTSLLLAGITRLGLMSHACRHFS